MLNRVDAGAGRLQSVRDGDARAAFCRRADAPGGLADRRGGGDKHGAPWGAEDAVPQDQDRRDRRHAVRVHAENLSWRVHVLPVQKHFHGRLREEKTRFGRWRRWWWLCIPKRSKYQFHVCTAGILWLQCNGQIMDNLMREEMVLTCYLIPGRSFICFKISWKNLSISSHLILMTTYCWMILLFSSDILALCAYGWNYKYKLECLQTGWLS